MNGALREALALKGLAEAIERAHISQGDDAETDARAILEHLPVISNVRPWKYLYDDYEAGTVFITRDPQNDQTALVAGLTIEQAAPIVAALNSIPSSPSAEEWRPLVLGPNEMHGGGRGSYVTPAAASPVAAGLDVERLARALTKEYRYLGRQPESEDDFLRFATVLVAAYEKPE